MDRDKIKPYIYLAFAILAWSSQAAITKFLVMSVGVPVASFCTFAFAIAGSAFAVFVEKKQRLVTEYTPRDLGVLFGMAALWVSGDFLYTWAFKFMPASTAVVSRYLWPVFLVVLAVPVLKEKLSARKMLGVILAFLGFVFLVSQAGGLTLSLSNWLPFLAILYSGISWVLLFLLLKRFRYESLSATLLLVFFGTILYGGLVFALAEPLPSAVPVLLAAAYFGIVTIGMGNAYYARALKHLDTSQVGNLSYLVPVLAIFWAGLFLGETIQWYYFVALGLIFAGYLVQRR